MDRQDIDALLVGSLYGELSPADQARLTAHLESHPGDRTALDDLKVARNAIRESRIFELQMEPPQAISALLLQEAARRAPKKVAGGAGEGWFNRFVRSFVAHPAMAAAAMLVLVVGVAGTLYMRNGDQVASPTVAQDRAANPEPALTAADQPRGGQVRNEGTAAGSAAFHGAEADQQGQGVVVGLVDGKDKNQEIAKADPEAKLEREKGNATHSTVTSKPAPPRKYVEVRTPDTTPRDLPEAGATKVGKADALATKEAQNDRSRGEFAVAPTGPAGNAAVPTTPAPGRGDIGGGGSTNGVVADNSVRNVPAQQPSPQPAGPRNSAATAAPPPPPAAAAPEKPADSRTVAKKPTSDDANKQAPDPLLAWAKDQHARIIALVKQNKCTDAGPIAVAIRNRAPDYYNAYVVPDRQIKSCMSYINDATENDAERSQKSKPAKRVDMHEAPAPTQSK